MSAWFLKKPNFQLKDSVRLNRSHTKQKNYQTCHLFQIETRPVSIRELIRHCPTCPQSPSYRTGPFLFTRSGTNQKSWATIWRESWRKIARIPQLVERGKKKAHEWGNAPGLLIVTCHTDRNSELVQKKPAVIEEDYATCCCICQNLLLLLEQQEYQESGAPAQFGSTKISPKQLDLSSSETERVVGLIFYGYSRTEIYHQNSCHWQSPKGLHLEQNKEWKINCPFFLD